MSLAAEVEKLYRAGALTLPKAANEYAGAGGSVHETGDHDQDGFNRSVPSGDSPRESMTPNIDDPMMMTETSLGKVQEPFVAFRNMLQNDIIWQTHKNLISAGEALVQIAESYASTDAEASSRLEDKKRELENEVPDIEDAPPRSGDE